MGEIVLTRIDDRLIHGQVMTAWVKKTGANQIVVIDNGVAEDMFMTEVLKASAPSGINITVKNVNDAVDFVNNISKTNNKVIILVKAPKVIVELLNNEVNLGKVIVGGMGTNPGRKTLYKNIAASNEERADFKFILDKGIPVFIHIIPDQKAIDLSKYI